MDFDFRFTIPADRQVLWQKVTDIETVAGRDDLIISYVNEQEEIVQESFDMAVLSVGLETSKETLDLAARLGIDLTEGNFCLNTSFDPVSTSKKGIYACGAFQGPKDIPQSVIEASSAAAEAGALLSPARNTLIREASVPEERNIQGERPRIGVFVCHCGSNIAGPARGEGTRKVHFSYTTKSSFGCNSRANKSWRPVQETEI